MSRVITLTSRLITLTPATVTLSLTLTLLLCGQLVHGAEPPLRCPTLYCFAPCPYGFRQDKNGCDTCDCVPVPRPKLTKNWVVKGNKQYRVFAESACTSHDNSRDVCAAHGAILPEPRNQRENTDLHQLTNDRPFYLGITDRQTEGQFLYESDQTAVTWVHWQIWENGVNPPHVSDKINCVVMMKDLYKKTAGPSHRMDAWMDTPCDTQWFHEQNLQCDIVCQKHVPTPTSTTSTTTQQQTIKPPTTVSWSVKVKTADEKGAGSNGDVYIRLVGDSESPEVELDTKNYNDFEQGHEDVYHIDTPDIGLLRKIILRFKVHSRNTWKLEWIKIENLNTEGKEYTFDYNGWMKKSKNITLTPRNGAI